MRTIRNIRSAQRLRLVQSSPLTHRNPFPPLSSRTAFAPHFRAPFSRVLLSAHREKKIIVLFFYIIRTWFMEKFGEKTSFKLNCVTASNITRNDANLREREILLYHIHILFIFLRTKFTFNSSTFLHSVTY